MPLVSLNLSKGWDTISQAEIVFENLKKRGINPEKSLYAGTDLTYLDSMLINGHHSKNPEAIFCSDYKDMIKDHGHSYLNALDIGLEADEPGLIVYRPEYFELGGSHTHPWYKITKSDAKPEELIDIIYKLKLNPKK